VVIVAMRLVAAVLDIAAADKYEIIMQEVLEWL